jgi:8-oxo-dGTP pyrophosphatase MutT (NUDIX family)
VPSFRKDSERPIYEGRKIALAMGSFVAPDGERFEREILHHPGAVSVVPLDEDGTVLLVRQYRAPLDADLLEIPAGLRDVAGEPLEVTANRELAEEVGRTAAQLELLAQFHNSAGFTDECSFVFLGTGLTVAEQDLQGVEERHLTIERLPLDDAPALIARGEITDAKTIIGLSLTLRRLGR